MRILRTTCLGLALCAGLVGCATPSTGPAVPALNGRSQVVWRHVPNGYRTQDFTEDGSWVDDSSDSSSDGSYDGSSDSSTVVLIDNSPQPVYVIDEPSGYYDSGNYDYQPPPAAPPVFSIAMVNVTPTQATVGSTVNLGVQITGEDPQNLDFTWTAQGGALVENKGEAVQWQAPTTPGIYNVTVTVSDPQTQQSQSSAVSVQVVAKGGN